MAAQKRSYRRGELRRRIVRLARAFPSLTAAQIAAIAGCHVSTVRKHLSGLRTSRSLAALASDDERASEAHRRLRPSFVSDPSREVRYRTARRPSCPPLILARLAGDPYWSVRWAAAAHPACPRRALNRLVGDCNEQVRMAVLARDDTNGGLFLRFAAGDSDKRYQAVVADRCPQSVLERLSRDPDTQVRREAAYKVKGFDTILRLSQDPEAEVRQHVAFRDDCPPAVIAMLANDPAERVRVAIADRDDCPQSLLAKFLDDPSEEVRAAAVRRSSSMTPEALDRFARDDSPKVRASVAAHPGCSDQTRLRLRSDGNVLVRVAARP